MAPTEESRHGPPRCGRILRALPSAVPRRLTRGRALRMTIVIRRSQWVELNRLECRSEGGAARVPDSLRQYGADRRVSPRTAAMWQDPSGPAQGRATPADEGPGPQDDNRHPPFSIGGVEQAGMSL